jgi:3-isopropylmalate/(R)-2-methylmalate dehydratase small subunit
VLLITLDEATVQRIGQAVGKPAQARITVDLAEQQIILDGQAPVAFEIDTLRKTALLQGLDAIGSTLQRREQIKAFEHRHLLANPWLS